MFERTHHQRIAVALQALDAARLRENNCLFGGDTVIALRFGEYRESVDIDFLVSDIAGYHISQPAPIAQGGEWHRCRGAPATLTPLDMVTSKLLANSDRWSDDGVFSRDLIDLAMMAPKRALFQQAMVKAEHAYGASVAQDLAKAIHQLTTRQGRLER